MISILSVMKHAIGGAFVAGDAYWLALEAGASPWKRVAVSLGAAALADVTAIFIAGAPWSRLVAGAAGAALATGSSAWLDHRVIGAIGPIGPRAGE